MSTFYLTEEQFDQLTTALESASDTRYADMYDLLYGFVQSQDDFGNAADGNVIAWFGAAKDANRGVGGASDFIRSYTAFQLEMRNGSPINNINSLIQDASNAIAEAVYQEIVESFVVKNGEPYYVVPVAITIGGVDAAKSVEGMQNYPGGVANWSGNPLFIGLGITDFWSNNILDDDGDAYDLALAVSAMFHALGATSSAGFEDLFALFFSQGVFDATWAGYTSGASAAGATHAYLNLAYGDADLGIGDLVAGGMIVGSAANETLSADNTEGSLGWLHAGGGADVILAATDVGEAVNECGVFDGGEGDDLMSFNNASITDAGGVIAKVSEWSSGVAFSAIVTATYGGRALDATLFDIERLHLSDADDRLVIDSLTTTLQSVDALDSNDHGDTIDVAGLNTGVMFDLDSGEFSTSFSSSAALTLANFENAIGTVYNDTIIGDDEANAIFGNNGADQLLGRGGDDFIFFDAEDTVINGGAGRDVGFVTGAGGVTLDLLDAEMEFVIGGAGADTFILRGTEDLMAAGGEGIVSDVFNVHVDDDTGLRTVWGGGGADAINVVSSASASLGIMVVQVDGLTTENFHLFDKSMLGLGANFDWSQIDLLILNPDSGDTITLDYGWGDVHALSVNEVSVDIEAWLPGNEGYEPVNLASVSILADTTFGEPWDHWYQVGHYQQNFLGGYSGTVFTNVQVVENSLVIDEYGTPDGNHVRADWYGEDLEGNLVFWNTLAEGRGLFGDGWNHEIDIDYDLAGADYVSGWLDQGGGYSVRAHYYETLRDEEEPIESAGGWFIVGGGLDGSEIVDVGAIQADMTGLSDERISDWLLVA